MTRIFKPILIILLAAVLLLPAAVSSAADEPGNGLLACTYTTETEAQSYVDHLYDGNAFTTLTLYRGERISMTLPDGARAANLFFHFFEKPDSFEVHFFDADGQDLKRYWTNQITGMQMLVPVEAENTARIELTATDRALVLSEWTACTESFVPPFADTGKEADVLVVLNEPGDELQLLGGVLADLALEHGLTVQVDYLTAKDGYHTQQCMEVLKALGVTHLPFFGDGRAPRAQSRNAVYSAIGDYNALLTRYTARIRALRPKLILTLDPQWDRPRFADAVISEVLTIAAADAADETRLPETAAHTVEKVYVLDPDGATIIDTDHPLYACKGRHASAYADALSALYREERVYRRDMPDTVRFTLVSSTVGADAQGGDLLEHLSTDRFAGYRVPTPTPVPTPEPTDTPEPTATPTAKPTEVSATANATQTPKRGLFSCGGTEQTPEPTDAPSPTPTPTATPTPSPAPTAEPTATPEPTPDPNDAYFLSEDGEQFELNFDEGHWWYKNRVLSIDIVEVKTELSKKRPVIYYVADIRMREYSSYRSGVRTKFLQPWRYVRTEQAVFAITGDNLDRAEQNLKGLLMRKGVFYSNEGGADTLIIDGMTMRVVHRSDLSLRVLLDHGVRDTYSFGPILVEDGAINPDAHKHRVEHPNPRCGIGMIEPGHWIAIVTDGRQSGYSYSISLETFAQLFLERGCTIAYNLDGGSSAAMCIMGEQVNKHFAPGTDDCQRPWVDAIMLGYTEQLPSPETPTKHDGYRH